MGTTKLEHQTAVEIESENSILRFTRWVRHGRFFQIQHNLLIIIAESAQKSKRKLVSSGECGPKWFVGRNAESKDSIKGVTASAGVAAASSSCFGGRRTMRPHSNSPRGNCCGIADWPQG